LIKCFVIIPIIDSALRDTFLLESNRSFYESTCKFTHYQIQTKTLGKERLRCPQFSRFDELGEKKCGVSNLTTVLYIQRGSVKLSVVNPAGKEAVAAILGAGDFFGDGAMAGRGSSLFFQ
jgi:hypothetical protein